MILDFIARINNVSYNVKLAKLFGINSAILLGILLDFSYQTPNEEYIKLSRQDIYNLCGIDEQKQIETEDNLKSYNLLEVNPLRNSSYKNYYKLNMQNLSHILTSDINSIEEELNKAYELFKKTPKAPKTVSKRAAIISNLKKAISVTDEESRQHLEQWVDEVYQKHSYLAKAAVEYMCEQLTAYAGKKITLLRQLCKNAARLAYKDPKWIIKNYEDSNLSSSSFSLNNIDQQEVDDNLKKLKNYEGETF